MKKYNETNMEIEKLIASKQFEFMCMKFMPILVILYLRFSGESFITNMYQSGDGVIVMCICFCVYIFAWVLADAILALGR